jgi:hypothetical protein
MAAKKAATKTSKIHLVKKDTQLSGDTKIENTEMYVTETGIDVGGALLNDLSINEALDLWLEKTDDYRDGVVDATGLVIDNFLNSLEPTDDLGSIIVSVLAWVKSTQEDIKELKVKQPSVSPHEMFEFDDEEGSRIYGFISDDGKKEDRYEYIGGKILIFDDGRMNNMLIVGTRNVVKDGQKGFSFVCRRTG